MKIIDAMKRNKMMHLETTGNWLVYRGWCHTCYQNGAD
jgi:hypothetical protein